MAEEPVASDSNAALDSDKTVLFPRLKNWFKRDSEHSDTWRKEAVEDYAFVAGDQWDPKDVDKLKTASRPVITFNRVDPLIRSVAGEQINNSQEVRYYPREQGDAKPSEILDSAAQWFRDQCDADDEESDAFWDASTCGMGWTDTRLDVDEDPLEPTAIIERIDPLEMFWDCDAQRRNLVDSRRFWRVRDMPLEAAKRLLPESSLSDLDASWARTGDGVNAKSSSDEERYVNDRRSPEEQAKDLEKQVTIVQCQWWEMQITGYATVDQSTGGMVKISPQEFSTLEPQLKALGLPSEAIEGRVYKTAFLGRTILQIKTNKCPHFTFNAITGFRDRNKNVWYGLVRAMKDPQRWANKWLSQSLHILNASAKGGVMAEKSAVGEDPAEFERSWTKIDQVTLLEDGALSGQGGARILPKPVAAFPASFFQLMQFAISSIRDVAGINLEMLGMREANQPASLEYQRRQAGVTILAQLFRSLRRYHRNQGKVMLYYIQNYLSDNRLIRIVGDQGAQYVPLAKQADVKYDIVVDEGPSWPNQKERVWSLVGQNFWTLPPEIQMALLEYSPFPASVVEKIKQAGQEAAEGPAAQMQEQMMQLQAELQKVQISLGMAEVEKTKAEAQVKGIEVQMDAQKLRSDQQTAMIDAQRERATLIAEAQMQVRDLALKEKELTIKEYEAETNRIEAQAKLIQAQRPDPPLPPPPAPPPKSNGADNQMAAALHAIAAVMARPRSIVRGKDGRAEGID